MNMFSNLPFFQFHDVADPLEKFRNNITCALNKSDLCERVREPIFSIKHRHFIDEYE